MTLSTLLVCDDTAKAGELEAIINSQGQLLKFTGVIDCEGAAQQVLQISPSVVWIELAPEPSKALALLGELRKKYPTIQFLVSYETLQADLVKTAMQLGAAEYIDPKGVAQLLPQAVERIQNELNRAILGTAVRRNTKPKVPVAPQEGESRPSEPTRSAQTNTPGPWGPPPGVTDSSTNNQLSSSGANSVASNYLSSPGDNTPSGSYSSSPPGANNSATSSSTFGTDYSASNYSSSYSSTGSSQKTSFDLPTSSTQLWWIPALTLLIMLAIGGALAIALSHVHLPPPTTTH